MFKKDDIFILCIVIGIAVASFVLCFAAKDSAAGKTVEVEQDGQVVYSDSLYKDEHIFLEHNTIAVEGGKVYMQEADCKHKICQKHKTISKAGESIICLPNKVIVNVK